MYLVDEGSIHLIVTSPPYWQLKDYGDDNQIGFHDSYEEYINNLNLVWQECHRVLHDGCRLCVNIGDQFARSVYYGRYKVIPIRTEIIRFCETIGFDFMGSIIWQKVTTCNTTGGATVMGSFPYPRNGIVKIDYEFILLFKKHGTPPKIAASVKKKSALTKEEWNSYFNGHWTFPGEKQSGHLAMFPEELPRRLIRMFSFVGETILDPFLGSGTTILAAINCERNSVGYEINRHNESVIKAKLEKEADLFESANITYGVDESRPSDKALEILPYQFTDPLRFDKKIDPRKATFGSRINSKTKREETYYKVSEVLSPVEFKLDTGQVIRLLGLSAVKERETEAVAFLNEKVRGKQIYMKYDNTKYDEHHNLLVYLYLKNRTFINAHLVKHGFAGVDTAFELKNKTLLTLVG